MSSINGILTRYGERVGLALKKRLPDSKTLPAKLHEAMTYAVLYGGKRVRACLVYAAGQAAGASMDVLDAPACAVELVHAYSLVHDDLPCMDDDDLRRGQATCHKAFDEATALLAGDALQALAFEILASDPDLAIDPERRQYMIGGFARAIGSIGMAGGQAIDLEATGKSLGIDELKVMHNLKTGALIRISVEMGAFCAPTFDKVVFQALSRYGEAIGLGFQIVDDILDVEGSTETLGKTAGADEAKNKATYPALLGLEEAKKQADHAREAALESITSLGDNGSLLVSLADYIIDRSQ